jgi:uncharacterized protein YjbI with pentapeptide repeats
VIPGEYNATRESSAPYHSATAEDLNYDGYSYIYAPVRDEPIRLIPHHSPLRSRRAVAPVERVVKLVEHSWIVSVLELLGKAAILYAIFAYLSSADERRSIAHAAAWQTISDAIGHVSGGRLSALELLARDGVSLAGVSLDHADLKGADLRGADLTSARLPLARLDSVDLSCREVRRHPFTWETRCTKAEGSTLAGASLVGADLSGAILDSADLSCRVADDVEHCVALTHARLRGIRLTRARLDRVKLDHADFRCLDYTFVDSTNSAYTNARRGCTMLFGASMRSVAASDAVFDGADLDSVRLGCGKSASGPSRPPTLPCSVVTGASFRGTSFNAADLTGLTFSSPDFGCLHPREPLVFADTSLWPLGRSFGVVPSYDSLITPHLSCASLDSADASLAILSNARLVNADLNYAIFDGARLNDAHLNGVRAAGASFRGADLMGVDADAADLARANFTCSRRAPSRCTRLAFAHMARSNLRDADLTGASVLWVDWTLADLRGMTISVSDWTNANGWGFANGPAGPVADANVAGASPDFRRWACERGAVTIPNDSAWVAYRLAKHNGQPGVPRPACS